MKKLNWFTRAFMSWNSLENYFNSNKADNTEIQELKVKNAGIEAELKASKERIEELKAFFVEKNKELESKATELSMLREELQKANAARESLINEKQNSDKSILTKDGEIKNLHEKIVESRKSVEDLKIEISKKLDPLSKIEKTFFAQSGNKGKGELGELQLQTLLEKTSMSQDMWTKNLVVGSTQVEFAIKAGIGNKWIPVDSKVLDADLDDENKLIINEQYKSRVSTQAKEVAKYLSKNNTADYGLLVLQNDQIYMDLFEKFPSFFEQMIKENKIYICSPSSFIQFAWSISHILDIYEKVHNDEKIYDEVIDVLTTVNKLTVSLSRTHKDFNTAMETHYPTLQTRQNKLVKKLKKEDKIKEIPSLGNQSNIEILD